MLSERVTRELEKFEGLWVAVTEDEVIAHGGSAKEAHDKAKTKTTREITVFKVPRRDEEAHIL